MGWLPRFNTGIKVERLIRQLEIDEGKRLDVYLDTEGLKTVGIGHLIKKTDPPEIRDLKVGDKITEEQCVQLFEQDLSIAITNFKVVFPVSDSIPAEVQEILVNMIFNLGLVRFSKFKNLIAAVNKQDWSKAADEMKNSKWYTQVGKRADRLIARMRTIHDLASS